MPTGREPGCQPSNYHPRFFSLVPALFYLIKVDETRRTSSTWSVSPLFVRQSSVCGNSTFLSYRVHNDFIILVTATVFALLELALGAAITNLTTTKFGGGYFSFAALGIATAILTFCTLPVMYAPGFRLKGLILLTKNYLFL